MTPRRRERRGEAVPVVGLKSVLSPFLVTHLTGQCPLWVGNGTTSIYWGLATAQENALGGKEFFTPAA